MQSMNEALLNYMEQSESEGDDDSPTLLRTLSRPLSNCPLFDVVFETDHSWPSSNLLHGSGPCRAVYANGAHLVMSGGRLLVVRESGHFYCPPWDSTVNDAHIEPHEADGYTLLTVALASGLYVALLQERSLAGEQACPAPVRIVSDAFVPSRYSVERVFATRDGEVTLCFANAGVATYHVAVDADMRVTLESVVLSRARRVLRAVGELFAPRVFRDAAYDAGRDLLFVLSSTEVALWARAAPCAAFATACVARVPSQAVAVLASTQSDRDAALVLADGSRVPLRVKGGALELRLCPPRPLPADVRVGSVSLACRGADGTTALYDARTRTLAVAAVRFPLHEGLCDAVEVVATAPLRAPAVGLACVAGAADPSGECFVAYGEGGVLARVAAPPLGAQLRALLRAAGAGPALARVVAGLGARRAAEAIAGAAFAGGAPVADALAPLLADAMRPPRGGRPSLGALGVAAAARAAVQAAAAHWPAGRAATGARVRRRAADDLRRAAAALRQWHDALAALLGPRGWLDCARPGAWTWGAGLIATRTRTDVRGAAAEIGNQHGRGLVSEGEMDVREALDAQAQLLQAVLAGLRGAAVICALRAIALDAPAEASGNDDKDDSNNNNNKDRDKDKDNDDDDDATNADDATSKDRTVHHTSRFRSVSVRAASAGEASEIAGEWEEQEDEEEDNDRGDDVGGEKKAITTEGQKRDVWALYQRAPLECIVWGGRSDAAAVALSMHVLSRADAASLDALSALSADLPDRARLAIGVAAAVARGPGDAALSFACDHVRALRDARLLGAAAARLEAAFPQHLPRLRLLLCARRRGAGGVAGILRALDAAAASADDARRALAAVMDAAAMADDAPLRDAARRFVFGRPLDDPRVPAWADVLAAQPGDAGAAPRSLTAAFCAAWAARAASPSAAAGGFSEIARTRQRLALGTRLMCIRLALDTAPTSADQLTCLVLLLQDELSGGGGGGGGPTEAADESDELRHHFLGERRLFEVAGRWRDRGGAKVQLDILKVHPETPVTVTAEVLHDLLAYLVDTRGAAPADAARNVLREYYDGYAAGFPLLPVMEFLGHRGEAAAGIAELMLASGVPPYTVFDAFLHFLNESGEVAIFGAGAAVATLAVTVTKLQGESRALCGTYLLERIHHIMAGDHHMPLGKDDITQLQAAEATLKMVLTAPSVSPG